MTADKGPANSTRALPDRAQVVIVGGGVIGANIAYHLTKLGWKDVLLLERRQLTSGTTWHAAGLITSAGMGQETMLWMARYTRDLYIGLEEETGQATGWNPIGHLHIASTPQRLETLRRKSAFVRGYGVDDHEISPQEFKRMWPEADIDDVLVIDRGGGTARLPGAALAVDNNVTMRNTSSVTIGIAHSVFQ